MPQRSQRRSERFSSRPLRSLRLKTFSNRSLLHMPRSRNLLRFPGHQSTLAARSRWYGRAVGTSPGMSEEAADLVGGFRRQDVFELAGLLLDFGLAIQGQAVSEETFGQTMPANDIGRPLSSTGSKFHDHAAVAGRYSSRFKRVVAGIHERFVIVRLRRMRPAGHQPQ